MSRFTQFVNEDYQLDPLDHQQRLESMQRKVDEEESRQGVEDLEDDRRE